MKPTFTTSRQSSWLIMLLAIFLGQSQFFAGTAKAAPQERTPPAVTHSFEGFAAWYNVPVNSLARRRAQANEFTAAHNRLPLGTLVRVTRLSNGQAVIVRITDRGITNRHASIDLCREAAEELGMIREGFSRVRLEIISEPVLIAAPDSNQLAAH